MDFLSNIFSNSPQGQPEEDQLEDLIKRTLSGNTLDIDPSCLYSLHSQCQTPENANQVMNYLANAMDEYIENPHAIFKALKLIIFLIKLSTSPNTFLAAAQSFAPEIQTVVNVSFDKPGASNVNTIHKYANIIYYHLMNKGPLPNVDIPPRPKTQPQQPRQNNMQPQSQNQPQRSNRPGAHPQYGAADEGSLFDLNDSGNNKNSSKEKYEDSGNFISGMMEIIGPRKNKGQNANNGPNNNKSQNLPEGERPRMPAVFANAGGYQPRSIPQPADFSGNGNESLLNFGDDFNDNDQITAQKNTNDDNLFGAFVDDSGNNNNDNGNNTDGFVFTSHNDSQNETNGEMAFNPFGGDFKPSFPTDSNANNDFDIEEEAPSTSFRYRPSGPRPKFDPTKMKKKASVVKNTVPQGDFDPFGTASSAAPSAANTANIFDSIPKDEVGKDEVQVKKQLSLAQRFGQPSSASQKQAQQIQPQIQQPQKQNSSAGGGLFDLLGDDEIVVDPISNDNENNASLKNTSANSDLAFNSFGSQPQAKQQTPQKQGSANVFDMFGEGSNKVEQKQNSNPFTQKTQPNQTNNKADDLFEPFGAPNQQQTVDEFDMFGSGTVETKPNTNSNTNPFTSPNPVQMQQQKASPDLFNPFGSKPQTPQKSPQQQQKLQPQQKSPQQPQQKQNAATVFDMLGDDLTVATPPPNLNRQQNSSNDLFDSFGTTSSPKPQPQQQQIPPKQPQQPQQRSNNSRDLFESFGTQPQKQQQAPKQGASLFDMLDESEVVKDTKPASQSVFDMLGSSTQAAQGAPKQPPKANDDFLNLF